MIGEYGANAGALLGETIWLNPDAANDNSAYGGDDGMGDYGMLAIVSRDSLSAAATTDWVHSDHLGGLAQIISATGTPVPLGSRAYSLPQAPGQHRTLDDLYYNRYRDY